MLSKFAAFLAVSLVVLSPLGVRAATTHVAATPITVAVYAGMLHRINPQMPSWQSHNLASHLLRNAAHWRIDPNLLAALVTVESRWHTYARSRTGAIGLGQLMPGTAAGLHVNPHDPIQNLFGSARYLSGLIDRYRGKPDQFRLACAAYNAGPHAVARFGGIPPYAETQRYVVKVFSAWHAIAAGIHLPREDAQALAAPDVAYWSADSSSSSSEIASRTP